MKNWFSNFLPFDKPLVLDGISYNTMEHYYQAMKTLNNEDRKNIAACDNPGKAKRMGKTVQLREDWDLVKLRIMEIGLNHKFKRGTTWHKKLIESKGDLVEWNYWHDNYWGSCVCKKCRLMIKAQNHLGILLMKLRVKHLRKEIFIKRS